MLSKLNISLLASNAVFLLAKQSIRRDKSINYHDLNKLQFAQNMSSHSYTPKGLEQIMREMVNRSSNTNPSVANSKDGICHGLPDDDIPWKINIKDPSASFFVEQQQSTTSINASRYYKSPSSPATVCGSPFPPLNEPAASPITDPTLEVWQSPSSPQPILM